MKLVCDCSRNRRNDLHDARDDLLKIAEELDNIYDITNSFLVGIFSRIAFAIAQAVMAIAFSYGVVLASKHGDQKCRRPALLRMLRSWLLVPAFALVSLLSFVFTLVFVIGSIGTADFCVDSPDPKMSAVLDDNQEFFDSSIYTIVKFYVDGCPNSKFPPNIDRASNITLTATTIITDLTDALAGLTEAEYLEVCGTEKLDLALYTVEAAACLAAASVVDVQNIFYCGRWRPLYTAVFHDAICYQGHLGLYYLCVTQFLAGSFRMNVRLFEPASCRHLRNRWKRWKTRTRR